MDSKLTPREKQCLHLSATGHSVKEIALFMAITVRQIERHRRAIFEKLNCKNIAQAVVQGVRYGEIKSPDSPSDS